MFCQKWGEGAIWGKHDEEGAPHEANFLKLDCSKIKTILGWKPRLDATQTAILTSDWYMRYQKEDVYAICIDEIEKFLG